MVRGIVFPSSGAMSTESCRLRRVARRVVRAYVKRVVDVLIDQIGG